MATDQKVGGSNPLTHGREQILRLRYLLFLWGGEAEIEKAGMLVAMGGEGLRRLFQNILFLISGIVNCIFLTVCGDMTGKGRVAVKAASMPRDG